MFTIYRSIENEITHLDKIEKEACLNIVGPTGEETTYVSENLNITIDHLKAAYDEEERARIEVDEECTIVLIDIPVVSKDTAEKALRLRGLELKMSLITK